MATKTSDRATKKRKVTPSVPEGPFAFAAELIETANAICTPGKGILAADESTGTIGKRLASINVENTEANRHAYRQLLCTTEGLGENISGVIMFEETLYQKTAEGVSFVDLLKKQGIYAGIKVDKGVRPLYGTDGETVTQGMTGLAERCKEYYKAGARFAKWRAVIHIKDSGAPTELAIRQNAETLARYGAICQANGLVPIIEPEVLMDGTHSIERSAVVTERAQAAVVKAMSDHHLLLEAVLLKPNMVRPGSSYSGKCSPKEIALATVRVLQHTLPAAVPGVVFLSGGMSEEQATLCLNEINKLDAKKPWYLSFSFGRALQQSVLKAWQGKKENEEEAKKQLLLRAKVNGLATLGKYSGVDGAKSAAAAESLHQKNYTY